MSYASLALRELEGRGYEIIEPMATGGMGMLFRVRHEQLGQVRVAKVIKSEHSSTEEYRRRFKNEAQNLSESSHENFPVLYDFAANKDSGTAWFVMEFIDGVEFKDLVEVPPVLSLGMVLEMAVQSLRALRVLHRLGMIHRDVSPDNIMLTRSRDNRPLIKLIDLGIAKALAESDSKTQVGFMGKHLYAAPEQQIDARSVVPQSDLYAFSVVLFLLLTGRTPKRIPGQPIDFDKYDPDHRVPDDLRSIVLTGLKEEPGDRMSSADDYLDLLEPFRQRHPFSLEELDDLLLDRTVADNSMTELGLEQVRKRAARFERYGLPDRALTLYEQILAVQPDDDELASKCDVLRNYLPTSAPVGDSAVTRTEHLEPDAGPGSTADDGRAGATAATGVLAGVAGGSAAAATADAAVPAGAVAQDRTAERPRTWLRPVAIAAIVVVVAVAAWQFWPGGAPDPVAAEWSQIQTMPSNNADTIVAKRNEISRFLRGVDESHPLYRDASQEFDTLNHLADLQGRLDDLVKVQLQLQNGEIPAGQAAADALVLFNTFAVGLTTRDLAQDTRANEMERVALDSLEAIREATGSEDLDRLIEQARGGS